MGLHLPGFRNQSLLITAAFSIVLPLLLGFSTHYTPEATGGIKGKILFKGLRTKLPEAKCISPEVCGATHSYDKLVVGKDGGVQYTLFYIQNPPAGTMTFPPPVVRQVRCAFTPHMIVASRGSNITFENDDAVLHNCHGYYFVGSERTTAFNVAQPLKGQQSVEKLRKPGMLNIECDAGHTWMSSWVWVTDNPYATVSDEHGEFSISGLPNGTYTLVMWHEGWNLKEVKDGRPVFSGPIREERQITVTAGNVAETNFELR